MGYRHPNPRIAKIHRTYSVEEMARLFNVHKNTARGWLGRGLKPIDGQRPTVIRGDEIRRFLGDRRTKAKRPCGPGRIYCVACRAPKVPAGKFADCTTLSETVGTLIGICPECNRIIYRRVNPQKLSEVCGELDVTIALAPSRIAETAMPIVNSDSNDNSIS